ncbi:TrmH family RNA methyltransferase [Streptomyces iconiensis]|uniref:TrmH family RNA methyltransferase n=1 Tax=Streptomyces iconiensis TaxID=1384038 RepID=A0ABT6ZWS5_9ACTN|nr:TrmH family RNA methyltransferase [Streptomyces iconiensis]MDJ1133522.1 TrmH family RNA methyltransferase [Streptomyces iconiensis]
MRTVQRITTRNARFQQWQALLTNRSKRRRAGEFLVQGVRPITLAVEHGWPVRALLHPYGSRLSDWARDLLASDHIGGERVALAPELLAELSERDEPGAELIAVVAMPEDGLSRIPVGDTFLGVLFDRPTSPGNIGSLLRSADAFGADGLIVTGHAADLYDPKSVRASTGSLFALPAVRVPSPNEVLDWLPPHVTVLATDEDGETPLYDADLTGPVLLLIGNETTGLSTTWRTHSHHTLRIPIQGAATSLNAANAATALLYETARQRR